MLQLLLKIFIIVSTFILLLIVAILITAWWLGAFTPVQVIATERGPYFIVTLLEPDSPDHLSSQIDRVHSYLALQGEHPGLPLGLFYQDPLTMPRNALEASGGWFINDSTAVDTPYTMLNINKQLVALTVIKINRVVAPLKIYPILKAWMERNGYQPAPDQLTLEIYHSGDSTEIQIPIKKIQ